MDRETNTYSATWFELFLEPIQPVQTEKEIAFITRHLPGPRYETVLDLCCGPGRHARLLAREEYRVTGVDVNQAALDKARSLSNGEIVYHCLDMRRLAELPGSFDAIINLWQSFGYFEAPVNADVLRQISDKLDPNGRLILDLYHRGFFERHQGVRSFERNGRAVTETKSMTGDWLTVELVYADGETDRFEWQLYTPDELCELAGRYGLRPLVLCTGFDEQRPASPEHPRMQVVFEKVQN